MENNTENKEVEIKYVPASPADDEIDLLELWSVIWKRRKFIGIFFISAVVISAVISLLLTPVYKSSVTVIPITSSSGSSSSLLSAAANFLPISMPISMPENKGTGKILAVLHSRTIAEMVVKDLNLIPIFIKDKNAKHKLLQTSAVLEKSVIISTDKKLGTIKISAVNKNPELARKIAAAYVLELNKILDEKALTMSKMNVLFLRKQLVKTKIKIKNTMSKTSEIQNKYGLTLPSSSGGSGGGSNSKNLISFYSIFQKGGTEFSGKLMRLSFLRAKYAVIEKMYQAAEYKALKHNLYIQVLDKPVVPYKPFKPNKKLIVAVAGISALFLSIFIVFFMNFIDNVKKKTHV
jgi:uncharacterized protein involved in exopolysaccharide biosynthesis